MAVDLAVGQIIETTVYTQQGPQIGVNVVHHEVNSVTGTPTPTDLDLATWWTTIAFGTGLAAKYAAVLNNGASFAGVGVTILTPFRQVTQYFAQNVTGTAGADPLPFQCSGLITKLGALPGRHGRGRIYVPFPSIQRSVQDAQGYPSPTGAYITDAGFIATALCSPVTGGAVGAGSVDMTPLIFNRALPGASITIRGTQIKPLWATQRRRSESGRPNLLPF